MVDVHTATAADFDRAAQRHANQSWLWVAVVGLVWWFASMWWALIPGVFLIWSVISSVSCSRAAMRLRRGTFPTPNINNGDQS